MHVVDFTVRRAVAMEAGPIPGRAAPFDKPQRIAGRIRRTRRTPAGAAAEPCGEEKREQGEKKTAGACPLLPRHKAD